MASPIGLKVVEPIENTFGFNSDERPQHVEEMLGHLQSVVPLDMPQYEPITAVFFRVMNGLHFIKGPPGTDKSVVYAYIAIDCAMCAFKVLMVAPSNPAVEALLDKILDFIPRLATADTPPHVPVRVVHYQTPATTRESMLEDFEKHVSMFQEVLDNVQQRNPQESCGMSAYTKDKISKDVIEHLGDDVIDHTHISRIIQRQRNGSRLSKPEQEEFIKLMTKLERVVTSTANIVYTTANNCASEPIGRLPPNVVLIDKFGQGLEPDMLLLMEH
ncbi:MAG: hypothetical protein MMC33_002109 [Icmadophila ericetorum]|nr:hypothetical protein [Icmadophila ericetorum]